MTATSSSASAFLPDASTHRPDPEYLQHLLAKTGLSERRAEKLLGLGDRSLRNFMQGKSRIPYTLQFSMEALARCDVTADRANTVSATELREATEWLDAAVDAHENDGNSSLAERLRHALSVLIRLATPKTSGVWFDAKQRPLRESDAGRLIVARVSNDLRFGRVAMDGFGIGIDAVPGLTAGGNRVGANVVTDYVLIDAPQS